MTSVIACFSYPCSQHSNTIKIHKKRYCPHCKGQTILTDSGIIRRNANGKDIYEFAIYKCERDHTWNKKLSLYKPKAYKEIIEDLGKVEQKAESYSESLDFQSLEEHHLDYEVSGKSVFDKA